jgi:hypothetical protein
VLEALQKGTLVLRRTATKLSQSAITSKKSPQKVAHREISSLNQSFGNKKRIVRIIPVGMTRKKRRNNAAQRISLSSTGEHATSPV